jgi:hypothetical protein
MIDGEMRPWHENRSVVWYDDPMLEGEQAGQRAGEAKGSSTVQDEISKHTACLAGGRGK